jgi:hypothetical protein
MIPSLHLQPGFSISIMIRDIKTIDFLEELHVVMHKWQGPTIIDGDFNVVRFAR